MFYAAVVIFVIVMTTWSYRDDVHKKERILTGLINELGYTVRCEGRDNYRLIHK